MLSNIVTPNVMYPKCYYCGKPFCPKTKLQAKAMQCNTGVCITNDRPGLHPKVRLLTPGHPAWYNPV